MSYFNRLFASIVSWGIRTWTWHQYRVYIDIQALQISILGGRIFFVGLRYHGNNETILVQNGHITWSYWLRRVRDISLKTETGTVDEASESNGTKTASRLPCRINAEVAGLEWFIYNRSPVYDSILAGLTDDGVSPGNGKEDDIGKNETRASEKSHVGTGAGSEKEFGTRRTSTRLSSSDNGKKSSGETDDLPLLLQLYPIHFKCNKAALVVGNENTKAILIVKADSLSGDVDVSKTETIDPYRQVIGLRFAHPIIEFRDNHDYKEDQAEQAIREKRMAEQSEPVPVQSFFHRYRRKFVGELRSMVPYWRRSVESFAPGSRSGTGTGAPQVPGTAQWQGLSRYLDDEGDRQRARWASVEYAAINTILDSPEASLRVYWDVVGKVAAHDVRPESDDGGNSEDINGSKPPAWAINVSIKGGSINYGPWADRCRADLQRTFAPVLCKDSVPATPLSVGADRVPTRFKLYIELEDETTLRVPTRETSKNWKWTGREPGSKEGRGQLRRRVHGLFKKSDPGPQTHQRPYGWLDVKVAANTTITYSMDMVAGPSGYHNNLQVDIPNSEISSSINHEPLWRSGAQRISCDLSTPLRWNALRQWRFGIDSADLELFLLRDHVFLLTDLVDDWSSGPPPEYLVFTPFKYHLDLRLKNIKLYLNVNDANIINNPTDMEDNTYIVISSPAINATACIPLDQYRPSKNSIPFDVRAESASIDLHVPVWNTQATFLQSTHVGRLENLAVGGAYHFNAATSPALTDSLVLSVSGQSPTAHLHGFTIRYFLKLKENYFGENIHFTTLEEYQNTLLLEQTNPEAAKASRPPHKKSNDLDVMLNIQADDPQVFLPANLYTSQRYVRMDLASLGVDLRFTNYYMDMELVLTPLSLSFGKSKDGSKTPDSATSSTQLFVDGLTVYGHRLFGLPPIEPTYLCNWDIAVGAISGECSTEFLSTLMHTGKAFGFTFDDDENALIPASAVVMYDVTFLRVTVHSVALWLHVEEAAFQLSTGEISVNYNDWARSHYSKRANIRIPDVKLSCVNSESAARSQSRSHQAVETDLLVQTSIHLATIGRKYDFAHERKLQQELVRREDLRTQRTGFLCLPGLVPDLVPDQVDPPAQSVPSVPQPTTLKDIGDDGVSINSWSTSRRSRDLRRQSSFLSFASASSQVSVIRPKGSSQSSVRSRRAGYLEPEKRAHSISSARHSAFFSVGDGNSNERHDLEHNTVAFSSQYFAPHFPMQNVIPTTGETAIPNLEAEQVEDQDDEEFVNFNLEDIDPDILSQEYAYSSVMLELPAGLTACFNPTSLRHVASLLSSLQPTNPDDILDTVQMSSMDEIFIMQRQEKMKGLVSDLMLRVPQVHVRFVNTSDLDSPDPARDEQDQYDFSITRLALASRSQVKWQDAFKVDSKSSRSSFHVRLQSADLTAAERFSNTDDAQAAVLAKVDHIMASMGTKDVSYVDVDVGSLAAETCSRKIEYLAALIHRTSTLATDLGHVFGETLARGPRFRQYFAHRLITDGQSVPDPVFLNRPSAVLRSARKHLRTYDSWKLAMRLRQMWSASSKAAKDQIRLDCWTSKDMPVNVREQAVASFQKWRSWDLDDVSKTVLMNHLFGRVGGDTPAAAASGDVPTLAVVRVRETRLLIDPGPQQNELSITDITTRLETQRPVRASSSETVAKGGASLVVVNVYCGDASIKLNWELCELVDDILKLYNRMQKDEEPPSPRSLLEVAPASTPRKDQSLHLVLSLARGTITVDTVNLHSSTVATNGTASWLWEANRDRIDTNLILNCHSVQSRLRSRAQALGKLVLDRPSVFVAYELDAHDAADSHTIKAMAKSQHMSVVVKQDPLIIAEVVEAVIRDEVAQLYRLMERGRSSHASSTPTKTSISDRLSAFRVNVAIFADQYIVSIPLLPSLTYMISGNVTRAAMAANFGREIIFDFDIKENSHEMRINVHKTPRTISVLQIPPTNGRVISRTEADGQSVMVFASVELVQLDAAAVYSLLTALNRPEFSSALGDIQQQSQAIQERISEVFGGDRNPSSPTNSRLKGTESRGIAYNVHLTLAGLEIFGNSPLRTESTPTAHISLNLDSVHVEVANQLDGNGPLLAYPEAHLNLRRMVFELGKENEGTVKSCGNLSVSALVTASSKPTEDGEEERFLDFKSDELTINLSPETVTTAVEVLSFMRDKIKDLDTTREVQYLRNIRKSRPKIAINDQEVEQESDIIDTFLSSITYTFQVCDIRIAWLANGNPDVDGDMEDLVFSLQRIEFGTRKKGSARLTIEDLQVQMESPLIGKRHRSPNSALLPEIIFNIAYVSTAETRRMAFQAVGKSLDLRLASGFIVPAAHIKDSISLSVKKAQQASAEWNALSTQGPTPTTADKPDVVKQKPLLGRKRMESFLVDADFAGAVVYLGGKREVHDRAPAFRTGRAHTPGKYGQFNQDDASTTLRSPGLAFKMEYNDNAKEDPSLHVEIKVDASSNILFPSVVPLIMDMTNSVKEVVSSREAEGSSPLQKPDLTVKTKAGDEENILIADPSAVLGKMKLNVGMRICRQEFSLSCQPIARVAATASFEDVYFTINTVHSVEQGNFFAISGAFSRLQASVQHVYSRESTGSFEVESITLSLMNSKHVSGINGLSAILKVSPMKVSVNAKQLQDFFLFREIWIPRDMRRSNSAPIGKLGTETSQGHLVQRYQQVAATTAFPWTATVLIEALKINVDLGQALGKSVFSIEDLWMSSKKTSDWEQNLCLGFSKIGVDSTGRMSGVVALEQFKLRTSIQWPEREQALNETPLIQASVGFSQFRIKAAFDYQAFLVADITSIEFLMYNVRRTRDGSGDRLVAVFDGDALQIYGTTTSAAQGIALFQAFQRLVEERKVNFESSLKEIERFMKRKSVSAPAAVSRRNLGLAPPDDALAKSPISLDTDVVVTLKALNLGIFPSTFSDHQVFKMEALNAQARFAASIVSRRIHSILGLTLGQLRIGLAAVPQPSAPKALSDLSVEDVVRSATSSRGGTILKVPRVEAVMQTWQSPDSNQIDYIFKSAFEGKVEVGWNYSRVSYIRGMWANHNKSLATTLGRDLPGVSAIKVTGVPDEEDISDDSASSAQKKETTKITAEVKMPQSKYEYHALEPPVIETPQLRDMGEATPPLEWIGLHRERLPNLTHQIVIVSLLELAGEVEDAYGRILGSS